MRVREFQLAAEATVAGVAGELISTTFETEWPPRSRKKKAFPEIDRIDISTLWKHGGRLIRQQVPFIAPGGERLEAGIKRAEPKRMVWLQVNRFNTPAV